MEFTAEQEHALQAASAWMRNRDKPYFYLAGYAGTGKTELARHLAQGVKGDVHFAAYTGKAASVLKERGCPASTIHSLIYNPKMKATTRLRKAEELLKSLEEAGAAQAEIEDAMEDIRLARQEMDDPDFDLKEESPLRTASLVVLDECSMIDKNMLDDLLAYNVPLLFLGDPAQLPPVKSKGHLLTQEPDALLTKVHRHDGNILRIATDVREGKRIPFCDLGDFAKMRASEFDPEQLASAQVLTGANKTRREINTKLRKQLGFTSWYPQTGDKLICLRNDRERGVLNGVQCTALSDARKVGADLMLDIEYEGAPMKNLSVLRNAFQEYFKEPEYLSYYQRLRALEFDHGYALTVHKAQGSQWDEVVVYMDGFAKRNKDFTRWLYTALTRAQTKVTVLV